MVHDDGGQNGFDTVDNDVRCRDGYYSMDLHQQLDDVGDDREDGEDHGWQKLYVCKNQQET